MDILAPVFSFVRNAIRSTVLKENLSIHISWIKSVPDRIVAVTEFNFVIFITADADGQEKYLLEIVIIILGNLFSCELGIINMNVQFVIEPQSYSENAQNVEKG